MKKVILYTTGCPKCTVLKKKLESANIDYEVIQDRKLMIDMGITNVPLLCVDDKTLDFGDAINWIKEEEIYANTNKNE